MRYRNKSSQQEVRIAIILSELRPGGMERVVVHLAKGLSSRDIATMVVCLQNPGELSQELEGTGVHFEALRSLASKDISALWRLRTLLRRFRPSVINVHDYASTPYAVTANWLAYRTPILFTAHGLLYEGFDKLRRRYRFFSKSFSGLTAVSEAVAERHKDYLSWPGQVHVIRNGVPAIQRNERLGKAVRAELGIRPDVLLFLAVGNPRPEKGFEDLIDATVILRNTEGRDRDFAVAVAGKLTDNEYCRMLHRRVEERGVQDRFWFIGFRSDTTALYSAADVFVLSSRSEGLPMVILESMMAGLPVIATRVGGVPDVVRDGGLLVEAADPGQLASAMGRMLSEEGLADRLGCTCREHALSTYGVDRMVDDYIACYDALVVRRSGA
ncbi:MAG: glycosyltransferase [Nitrospiraceae bacterium]|nr:glycosyltransferase [Nitrospiraceae bacterium]